MVLTYVCAWKNGNPGRGSHFARHMKDLSSEASASSPQLFREPGLPLLGLFLWRIVGAKEALVEINVIMYLVWSPPAEHL